MKNDARQKIKKVIAGKTREFFDRKADSAPKILYVNLGAECNQNCNFCLIKGNEHKFPLMDIREAKRVIRDFLGAGGEDIMFTGGEPTLRRDLPEIVDYTEKQKNLNTISIITNAVRMADKYYAGKIFEADKKHKLGFSVSLHSDDQRISEKITASKGTFKKTVEGMQNIVKNGRRMSVYHAITNENFRHLPRFCAFLKKDFPEIRSITLAYPFPQGNALLNKWIYVPFSSLKPSLIEALSFLDENGYDTNIAACGQFPLCVIPGFEEKVLQSLAFGEERISGVVGQDVFHEFEWGSKAAVDFYKNKHSNCRKCILSNYCQGFWKEYIELFDFDGLKPVTVVSFMGNKFKVRLRSTSDVEDAASRLAEGKLNAIILSDYEDEYLKDLIRLLKEKNALATIIKSKNL
ncbi:MAG TPA: radical SAM protein [Candidatus Colwellbacteria bacterium]|nr:radical SAM protein [Candidatus Colwellbacteria bacterium]